MKTVEVLKNILEDIESFEKETESMRAQAESEKDLNTVLKAEGMLFAINNIKDEVARELISCQI